LEKEVYPTFDIIEKRFKEKGGDYIIIKVKIEPKYCKKTERGY